jgi:hypothetical protein
MQFKPSNLIGYLDVTRAEDGALSDYVKAMGLS